MNPFGQIHKTPIHSTPNNSCRVRKAFKRHVLTFKCISNKLNYPLTLTKLSQQVQQDATYFQPTFLQKHKHKINVTRASYTSTIIFMKTLFSFVLTELTVKYWVAYLLKESSPPPFTGITHFELSAAGD